MNNQAGTIDFSVFEQVDVRVGRITSVEVAEGCRVPAYKLVIDFGGSIAQSLIGRQVLAPKSQKSPLDTVSTTCDSGWVRSRAATDLIKTGVDAAHPPAIAGGTDCVQRKFSTLEAKPRDAGAASAVDVIFSGIRLFFFLSWLNRLDRLARFLSY